MSNEEKTVSVRVMQSFGPPRASTNPYIHLLDDALARDPHIQHLHFDRRRALLGKYDVLHVHWPETLLTGRSGWRATLRRAFVRCLLLRIRFGKIALVRTLHNVTAHEEREGAVARLLAAFDAQVDGQIILNSHTPVNHDVPVAVVPHGRFTEWYGDGSEIAPTRGRIAFVGLVRRYKGIEQLIEAFSQTGDAGLSLSISGKAQDEALATEIRTRAAADTRIDLNLTYLSEDDFKSAVLAAEGIVLPYTRMHNSGAVFAALSLGRPVLVPRNEVTEDLAAEVGPEWVQLFDGEVTSEDLERFLPIARSATGAPDLSARGWEDVSDSHLALYLGAIAHHRAGTERRRP